MTEEKTGLHIPFSFRTFLILISIIVLTAGIGIGFYVHGANGVTSSTTLTFSTTTTPFTTQTTTLTTGTTIISGTQTNIELETLTTTVIIGGTSTVTSVITTTGTVIIPQTTTTQTVTCPSTPYC